MLPILLCISVVCSYAQSVTLQEAKTAAINTMLYESRIHYSEDSIININQKISNGNVMLYEIVFRNGSSVMISGHKACTPILSMSLMEESEPSTGMLNNVDSLPPALQDMLNHYAEQIDYCFSNNLSAIKQSEWDSLLYGSQNTDTKRKIVFSLVKTKWGQERANDGKQAYAYNYLIPGCKKNCALCGWLCCCCYGANYALLGRQQRDSLFV